MFLVIHAPAVRRRDVRVGRKSPPSPHQHPAVPRGGRGLCLHRPPVGFVKHVLLLRDFDDLPELTLGSGDKRHSQASSSESPWGG